MTLDFFLASSHHIALLLLVAVLGGEALLLRQPPSEAILRSLGRVDALYGLSALALLLIGGARLSAGAKGIEFYSGNPVFWLKIAIFVVIGVISIVPTVRFIRWRKMHAQTGQLPDGTVWQSTRKLVMAQLHLLPFVAIAAAAMARGLGH
jgi:putative membrane protein